VNLNILLIGNNSTFILFCLLFSSISDLILFIEFSFKIFINNFFAFSRSFLVKNFVNLLDHQLNLVIDFAKAFVLLSPNFGIVNKTHFLILVFFQE
jgi:hypothetical protein